MPITHWPPPQRILTWSPDLGALLEASPYQRLSEMGTRSRGKAAVSLAMSERGTCSFLTATSEHRLFPGGHQLRKYAKTQGYLPPGNCLWIVQCQAVALLAGLEAPGLSVLILKVY